MSTVLLGWAVTYAEVALGLICLLATARLLWGPRAQDRVPSGSSTPHARPAASSFNRGRSGSNFFFEAAAVIAILGFSATAALAKFLLRGEVIE